jgi:hypothetical protein
MLGEGSGEKPGRCGTSAKAAISIESGRASLSCSNVARLATEALAALDAGQLDLARGRLAALITANDA